MVTHPYEAVDDERCEAGLRRERLVGQIHTFNPSARIDWLGRFDDGDLRDYLDRLERLAGKRGRESRWERRNTAPAIIMTEPEEN
jgi:hypothetical protein